MTSSVQIVYLLHFIITTLLLFKPQEYVQWVNFKNIIFFFSLHFFCVGHKVRPWSGIWYSFARDKLLVKSWESLAKNPGHQRESRYCTYLGYLKTREKVSCYCQLWHWYRYSESLFEPFFSSRNSWTLYLPNWLICKFSLKYPYFIHQTGDDNTQTYQVEVVILIQH